MKVGTDGVLLGAWARVPARCGRVLDVGTGTGLIALMMAQRCPDAMITGIDIEPSAAGRAAQNAAQYIAATLVRGQNAIPNHKGHATSMVGNNL